MSFVFLLHLPSQVGDIVTKLPNATQEGPVVPGMGLQDEMNTGDRKIECRQDSHCTYSLNATEVQKSKRSSRSGVAREGPGAGPPEDRAEDRGDGYR